MEFGVLGCAVKYNHNNTLALATTSTILTTYSLKFTNINRSEDADTH